MSSRHFLFLSDFSDDNNAQTGDIGRNPPYRPAYLTGDRPHQSFRLERQAAAVLPEDSVHIEQYGFHAEDSPVFYKTRDLL